MPVSQEFLDYLVDQLRELGAVTVRRMFGGAGLYFEGRMFALVADDVAYLKVGDSNREEFVKTGMGPFLPFPDKHGKTVAMSYYEIPAEVLEDPSELAEWARRAVEVAAAKPPAKPKGRSRN